MSTRPSRTRNLEEGGDGKDEKGNRDDASSDDEDEGNEDAESEASSPSDVSSVSSDAEEDQDLRADITIQPTPTKHSPEPQQQSIERRDSSLTQTTTTTSSSTRSSISLPAQTSPKPPSTLSSPTVPISATLALQAAEAAKRIPPPPAPPKRKHRNLHRRRGESIKLSHVPLDLSTSTFDLMTIHTGGSSAGGFKPSDPYTKFLIGQSQKTIRVPVPNLRTLTAAGHPIPDAVGGPTPAPQVPGRGVMSRARVRGGEDLTVGKATAGLTPKGWSIPPSGAERFGNLNRSKREAARKEAAKLVVMEKWGRLEDLRVSIIACMASLKHYHHMLQLLKEENKKLEDVHKNIASIQHAKVSQILSKTEECSHEIMRLRSERTQQRVRLKAEWKRFLRRGMRGMRDVEYAAQRAQERYDEIVNEYEELIEFEKTSKSDPLHLSHLLTHEREKLAELKETHVRSLKALRDRFNVEQEEAEEEVEVKIAGFLEVAETSLTSSPLQQAHLLNARLRHEIAIHEKTHSAVTQSIETLISRRGEHLREKAAATMAESFRNRGGVGEGGQSNADARRKVLTLRKWMTCTPEMEFGVTVVMGGGVGV
ncbi:hypothetical protein HDV00_011924, partial [Rhizophlyctis rosea]